MGVDTRLYINNRWNINDIKDVIEDRFNTKVKINFHEFAPDYITLEFKAFDEDRMLHVHRDTEIAGFKATKLDFRSNDNGHKILRTLAETFGGLFNENDFNDDFEAYGSPDYGNAQFLINEAIKKDPSIGMDKAKLINFLTNWKV